MAQFISTWTDDRKAQLTKLWNDGYSCAQIAAEMGEATRNSVIGKVHRLGLTREKEIRVKVNAPRAPREHKARIRIGANGNSNNLRAITVSETEQYRLRCVEIDPLHLTFNERESGDCAYPYGDGPSYTYCGHPKLGGSSYCGPHHHLCWVKPQPNKGPKARKYYGTDFARGAA